MKLQTARATLTSVTLSAFLLLSTSSARATEYTVTSTPISKTLPAATLTDLVNSTPLPVRMSIPKQLPIDPDEPVLTDTHRAKRTLKHPLGQKLFTYSFGEHQVIVKKRLKVFADARPFPQQHPYKSKLLKTRKSVAFSEPFTNTAMNVYNIFRGFHR